MPDAIVLFAHGAREPEWAEPFKKIQELVAAQLPQTKIELAFLEIMRPSLPDAIEALAVNQIRDIRIVPLFLAQGGHLKQDLPKLVGDIQKSHPDLSIDISRPIGEIERILQAIAQAIVVEEVADRR
jgi:sirohydrochlorin cobaltochelatase